jgi:hypothetical protein
LRAEKVERSFAIVLDRGGLRRTHLRGRDNVQKRYLVHLASDRGSGNPRAVCGQLSKRPAGRIRPAAALAQPAMAGALLIETADLATEMR